MAVSGFMCGPRLYKYAGWFFEFGYCGPWPLKKDGELMKRAGRKFYKDLKPFFNMADKQKSKYRVGGGCIAI